MRLSELLSGVPIKEVLVRGELPVSPDALQDVEVAEVHEDSRQVGPGDLFVAVPGHTVDGHRFVKDATRRGAVAAVVQHLGPPEEAPGIVVQVESAALALSQLAQNRYGRPADQMTLIGITGTNGKTTTNFLIEALLRHAGMEPGLFGTVVYRFKDQTLPAPLTTPGPMQLHSTLRLMRDHGVQSVTMEASSHALQLGRLLGLRFRVAAFTNLTQDHLDFHGDMEHYFAAKVRLFTEHLLPQGRGGVAVVNLDGEYGHRMAQKVDRARLLTVSLDGAADICVSREQLSVEGISATLFTPAGEVELRSPLIGRYNLANLAVAAGVGVALGLPASVISAGLSSLSGVPGRVQRVEGPDLPAGERAPSIFVDYAHTPDALLRAMAALRPLLPPAPAPTEEDPAEREQAGRLIVVFGCGGDRDRTKRPLMGQAVARDADLAIVTSDNPRTENPTAIVDMIVAGVVREPVPHLQRGDLPSARRGYFVEVDRRQAIRAAVLSARPSDIVLIAGKGHEDYQIVGTTRHHFDDSEEVKEALCLRADSAFAVPAPAPSIDLPIERVLQATQGQLLRGGARKFTQVVIDGRTAAPGALFVAIRGERHDGHSFVAQAVEQGATGVLVERGRLPDPAALPQEVSLIEVDDTIVALGQLARAHREAPEIARNLRVVAVTGSTGKTSTKEMVAAILEAHADKDVCKTEGNLNNHLGVPLTLLRLRAGHRFAVVEMGMSARGEIAYLTSLARPDVGIITNVGPVHLESLHTVDNVAQAKAELWTGMADGTTAICPAGPDHDLVQAQAVHAGVRSGRLRGFSAQAGTAADGNTISVEVLSEDADGLSLRFSLPLPQADPDFLDAERPAGREQLEVKLPLLGAHNAENAALAVAAALSLDVPRAAIVEGLLAVRPSKHRGQLLQLAGRHVIDDCYNASPLSTLAALRTLRALCGFGPGPEGKVHGIVLLGDMLELGPGEIEFHRQVGQEAAACGVSLLVTLGPRAAAAAQAAAERGVRTVVAGSVEEAAREVARGSAPGDCILIKASRGMQLERVLSLLPGLWGSGVSAVAAAEEGEMTPMGT